MEANHLTNIVVKSYVDKEFILSIIMISNLNLNILSDSPLYENGLSFVRIILFQKLIEILEFKNYDE